MTDIDIETTQGPAQVALDPVRDARALVLLGHGAGGGVDARDLLAVRAGLLEAGYAVARLTQPYRLAGRRAPSPPAALDAALTEVVAVLRRRKALASVPLVVGGRSSGARIACRTAQSVDAVGVLALAFPLHPPGKPERSRAPELHGAGVPTLVLQGDRDTFGSAQEILATRPPKGIRVHELTGANHSFAVRKGEPPVIKELAQVAIDWLEALDL